MTFLALVGGAGCLQPGRPPVAERSPVFSEPPGTYEVRPGDTLYAIAWRFGLDYRSLARANGMKEPYTIYVGQRVRLDVGTQAPVLGRRTVPTSPAGAASERQSSGSWRPPTRAPGERSFGNGNKGIDYRLGPDHAVSTAAAGQVVYAGSGLGGFRHLVIIKHDDVHLSAYSIDRPLRVREGEAVRAGAVLADAEGAGERSRILHFEVRRNGAPVDPAGLLGR